MQTLTFVCRQDFRIWIMHCYSWIGPYRDTAACVCSAQCVFRTHCKCSFSACQCISPWLRLLRDCFVCVKVKLKGQFTQHWQLKKPCRHLHENIASLLCCTFWHFIYTQTRFWVTEGEDFSKLQGKDSVLTRWRKRGGGFQHQGGCLHLIYLTWDCETCLSCLREVIFCNDWGRPNTGALMQLSGLLLCFHIHTSGLRQRRWLMNCAVVPPVLGQHWLQKLHPGWGMCCAHFSC